MSPAIPTPEYHEQVHRMLHALSEARVPFDELTHGDGFVRIRVGEHAARFVTAEDQWFFGSLPTTFQLALDALKAGATERVEAQNRPLEVERLVNLLAGLPCKVTVEPPSGTRAHWSIRVKDGPRGANTEAVEGKGWVWGLQYLSLAEVEKAIKAHFGYSAKDTRPLIDRLREAVPGLEWEIEDAAVVGRRLGKPQNVDVAIRDGDLRCWINSPREPNAVDIPCPSDDEVVRIVRDWYDKTHPAKSILERTKELIREAVPGVEITEQSSRDGIYLHCTIGSELGTWSVYQPAGMTGETFERTKDKLAEAARKALVKPTNAPPQWAGKMRDELNKVTSDSWYASFDDGVWQVASAKNGQRIVVTAESGSGTYRVEVREGSGVLPYREKTAVGVLDLVPTLCKARADLGIPEEAQKFAQEMRDAGFEVSANGIGDDCAAVVVRSAATGKAMRLTYGTLIGWGIDGVGPRFTREQASTRVRTELTKPPAIVDMRNALVSELVKVGERPTIEDAQSESGQPDKCVTIRTDGAWWQISNEALAQHPLSEIPALAKHASERLARDAADHKKKREKERAAASAEHEAFERRAREATTQYLQNAGMSLTVPLTAKQRCESLADVLADDGVIAIIETIDDHCAVCVTDPSTGEVHRAICDPAGKWLMDGEEVYGLVAATELKELAQRQAKKKGKRMDLERVKELAVNAAYLTAANKVTESMQTVIVAGLMRQLGTDDESVRLKLAAFFSSELGGALIAGSTGFALQVLPHEEDGRIERLAESLQTNGMAKAMGAAVDVILQPMLGSVQEALKGLPEPPKVRATIDAPAEEHEEPAHTGRKARAAR